MSAAFNIEELKSALRKLKSKKAPGSDGIHNDMLKHLGPSAQLFLLQIINQSWTQGKVPTQWKEAEIIPILKGGKPKEDPHSYRPISLVSCTGKVMERMINERLMYYLESNNIITNTQSGYRKYRNTEDQLAYLSQSIENAFQQKQKVLAVFVDLSSAFDEVWKRGLLYKLLKLGVKNRMYKWIKSFLLHRTARVKLNNVFSRKIVLKEGVPQGGVLSPTLFLVFINDIMDAITNHVSNSLHADDLAIWTASDYTSSARVRIQQTVNNIDQWTKEWGLILNTKKTCATVFSLSTKKEKVSIQLQESTIPQVENPPFLGVTLDQRLTWRQHIDSMEERSIRKLALMKKLAGTTWGSNLKVLKQLYTGSVRPVMEYATTSWGTAAKTNCQTLDKVQNMGLRIILGAMKTTPIKEMERTANIEPLNRRRKLKIVSQSEKMKRLPTHPLHSLLDKPTKNRIKRQSLNHLNKIYTREYSDILQNELPVKQLTYPHYTLLRGNSADIKTSIPGITSKLQPPAELQAYTADMIDTCYSGHSWTHIFTDGSATEAVKNGGAGVYIRYTDGEITKLSFSGGRRCTNYRAELIAIKEAIAFILEKDKECRKVVIFSDSLSALQALESNSTEEIIIEILNLIQRLCESSILTLQWVPAHVGLHGNEMADKLAKEGSLLAQPDTPITYPEAKSIIRNLDREEWIALNQGYRADQDTLNRLDRFQQTKILRLRTGHCRLNSHLYRLGIVPSANCPCGTAAQTPEHILQTCPSHATDRKVIWPKDVDLKTKLWGTEEDLILTAQYIQNINVEL